MPSGVDILALVFCFSGMGIDNFILNKANRLLSGSPVGIGEAGIPAAAVVLMLAFVVLSGAYKRLDFLRISAVSAVLCLTCVAVGGYASGVAAESPFARVSFSTGFWMFALGCMLFFMQAYASSGSLKRFFLVILMYMPLVCVIAGGLLNDVSVMVEYANYNDRFSSELLRHIYIAFGSIMLAVFAGIPIGIISARRSSLGGKLFSFLNIVQTIPSIALFGLLMVPLAWAASNSVILKSAGVSGIGWAPAVIALFLYSLLPIARNTYEGVKNIGDGVIEAAKGVGMTRRYMLFKVELPLSMPVILNGVRIALVQSIGNTAVVSLIGAGGMGVFIFQGLGQSAVPLIMLGTIPTIIMAVLADSIMQILISFSKGAAHDRA
ncbi:binding-protein-dependent transport systems inner membrane component [Denitrovibrio acetiphilus DSM 12809]|uniref:Binding-protein-dependent transport systems inner membrane component n=1 Tax=Denitrovibrio acetiphilus (strain DSM 12809 / NBRC 114555 / N2460) TaxID=522772 RepID=D4H3U6_DENA2|nr:ABC transporter permease [Denitrovibrio acetiphilus]ADD69198.1 binding-protein-dependent transport systems inner membrane component [Denitrovibrio acetiphilus DSM 12809]